MSDTYTAIRNIAHNHCFQFHQVLNAVVHEKYLSVPAHLEVYRFRYYLFVKRMHLRLYRIAVGRWCLYNREVTSPHQRKLKCTRNRCCRHGQCVYIDLYLTHFFFYTYSKLLFFIDNQQTQIMELYTFTDNLMRTYQNIDSTSFQLLQNTRCIFSCTGTAQIFYLTRHPFQTFTESLVVLISQYSSRNKHSNLLIVGHGLKCGTYGNFCFSEAHITTHKAIHRTIALHIGFYFLSSFQLVGSVLIDKACLQFMLHKTVRTIFKPFFLLTL